ncbi:unnamed protein product [Brassicogethes aeneus]|uniref:Uncharacterized protein n=1 Tax=Brassicogethes aeneus TaxID=1431903 RepID=A0A9P0B044_BRAAE|nr:unnamed protein product [Brassicogethes aeneus]
MLHTSLIFPRPTKIDDMYKKYKKHEILFDSVAEQLKLEQLTKSQEEEDRLKKESELNDYHIQSNEESEISINEEEEDEEEENVEHIKEGKNRRGDERTGTTIEDKDNKGELPTPLKKEEKEKKKKQR